MKINNHQISRKFQVRDRREQKHLRDEIMELLALHAGLVENVGNFIWKVQARDDSSVVTISLYTSGNLMVIGHGKIFDLTLRLICLYHKPIPKP